MEKLIFYISYLLVISASVERVVQMLKINALLSKLMSKADGKIIQLISVIVGTGLAWLAGVGPFNDLISNPYMSAVVVGLLSSAGSGIWHDMLSMFQSLKTNLTGLKS